METKNKCGRKSAVLKILQVTIMNSSLDEVKEKEIAFLPGNFYNVRFSEKGDAERLSDLILCIRPHSFKHKQYRERIVIQ